MKYLNPSIEMYLKASEFYGLEEVPGGEHNQIILDWFADIGFTWVKNDETAWCSCFINWVALKCGCERSFKLDARSWLKIGKDVLVPKLGHVVVLWREKKTGWKGHVGLFAGKNPNGDIYVLGGNQNNKVNIKLYNKYKLLGYRKLETA